MSPDSRVGQRPGHTATPAHAPLSLPRAPRADHIEVTVDRPEGDPPAVCGSSGAQENLSALALTGSAGELLAGRPHSLWDQQGQRGDSKPVSQCVDGVQSEVALSPLDPGHIARGHAKLFSQSLLGEATGMAKIAQI